MQKTVFRMSLIAGIMLLLHSSSFFLNKFLSDKILSNHYNQTQYDFAVKYQNEAAINIAWQQSEKYTEQWLTLAKILAKTEGKSAFELARYYQHLFQQPNGPSKSIVIKNQMLKWLARSIRLNYEPAAIMLARYYIQQNDFSHAEDVLTNMFVAQGKIESHDAQLLRIEIAVNKGDLMMAKKYVKALGENIQSSSEGRLLEQNLNKYQIFSIKPFLPNQTLCENSIQFFATDIDDLQRLEKLISAFKHQPLSDFVCFAPVRYIPLNTLVCNQQEKGKTTAIQCREENWGKIASSIQTRFVGLMLPVGGANVHFGAIYIDRNDSAAVLSHEISHLLGFIDEYPLKEHHQLCQQKQVVPLSENIVVIKKHYQGERKTLREALLRQIPWRNQIESSTPILTPIHFLHEKNKQWWVAGTPKQYSNKMGLFKANTCDNRQNIKIDATIAEKNRVNFQAYKPLMRVTNMQYVLLEFPKEYINFLKESHQQFVMPSFHYNIAISYAQKDSTRKAMYWLKQSLKLEKDETRKQRILQGNF